MPVRRKRAKKIKLGGSYPVRRRRGAQSHGRHPYFVTRYVQSPSEQLPPSFVQKMEDWAKIANEANQISKNVQEMGSSWGSVAWNTGKLVAMGVIPTVSASATTKLLARSAKGILAGVTPTLQEAYNATKTVLPQAIDELGDVTASTLYKTGNNTEKLVNATVDILKSNTNAAITKLIPAVADVAYEGSKATLKTAAKTAGKAVLTGALGLTKTALTARKDVDVALASRFASDTSRYMDYVVHGVDMPYTPAGQKPPWLIETQTESRVNQLNDRYDFLEANYAEPIGWATALGTAAVAYTAGTKVKLK